MTAAGPLRVVVIGAGMAGLTAARLVAHAGQLVSVLDKGRRVGGRMATRQLTRGATADHGAQFFTVRSEAFSVVVAGWLDAGIVRQSGILVIPDFIWELSLGIYRVVKGFKPCLITDAMLEDATRPPSARSSPSRWTAAGPTDGPAAAGNHSWLTDRHRRTDATAAPAPRHLLTSIASN